MSTTLETILVPVTFSGLVEVQVPADAPLKERLAQLIALSSIIATTDNPDAPDESAFEDYCEALGIAEADLKSTTVAATHFDGTQVLGAGGNWTCDILPDARGLFPGDDGFSKGPKVTATLTDDEKRLDNITFDASLWFEQASDKEILDLSSKGWRSSYEADQVGEFFGSGETANPRIVEFFDRKVAGFEVYVNDDEAVAWVKVSRPSLVIPEE